ncbi:MAG: hypothetical protein JO283_21495 [Bradyrhizobium sp.]|jgi:hypothetical protein|nr:hypothetical protein [Bradyrhizobium sp.]
MSPVTSPWSFLTGLAIIVLGLASLSPAAAESGPDTENGRYSLSQTPDGLIRLDTRTGAVSSCSKNGNGWACYAVPDEGRAMDEEIRRLKAENERLKAQLAARDQPAPGEQALPKSEKHLTPKAEGERRIEIPLPSDADVDRVISFLEQAWRRLVDMANRMQKDASGKV